MEKVGVDGRWRWWWQLCPPGCVASCCVSQGGCVWCAARGVSRWVVITQCGCSGAPALWSPCNRTASWQSSRRPPPIPLLPPLSRPLNLPLQDRQLAEQQKSAEAEMQERAVRWAGGAVRQAGLPLPPSQVRRYMLTSNACLPARCPHHHRPPIPPPTHSEMHEREARLSEELAQAQARRGPAQRSCRQRCLGLGVSFDGSGLVGCSAS